MTTHWFRSRKAMCKAVEAITEPLEQISNDGAYATVYSINTPGQVLKVGPSYDLWLIYALYVLDRKTPNPHLPRIYSLDQYRFKEDPSDGWYVAKVEMLYHPQDKKGDSYRTLTTRLEQHAWIARFLIDEGKIPSRSKWSKVACAPYPRWAPSKSFVAAARFIKQLMMNEGLEVDNIDTHYYNLMMRGNTIVLNDPIS